MRALSHSDEVDVRIESSVAIEYMSFKLPPVFHALFVTDGSKLHVYLWF